MATRSAALPGLHAQPGDRLVIRGHRVGDKVRDGEIVEVLGEDGRPPFLVRWTDDGHMSRVYPGSDAFVERFQAHGGRPARGSPKAR